MKHQKIFYGIFLVIFILGIFIFQTNNAKANDWLISPEPADVDTDTEFCLGASVPAGGLSADYSAEFQFAAGFDLSDLTISDTAADSEVVFYTGTQTCSGGTARITEAFPATADNDRDLAAVSGQKVTLTLEDALGGGTSFSIKFRTQAGTSVVTPVADGNYILIARVFDDVGNVLLVDADLMYVGTANQVIIYATVDPSLTLTLSATTCDLGTFDLTKVNTCQYDTTVTTNASSGYTAFVRDDGNLRNLTNDINDVAGGTTDPGTEAYGMATSDTDPVDITAVVSGADCTTANGGTDPVDALALTTSDQSYATEGAPVDSDVVTLCHSASIAGSTPAGAYAQTITITVIGNF